MILIAGVGRGIGRARAPIHRISTRERLPMHDIKPLEDRLRVIEDRLAIYNLLASHPLSADTGEPDFIESIYTEDFVFDRGGGLSGARGRDKMVDLVESDAHRTAIAGGLAHFGSLPLVELDGDTAVATSYIALITPDEKGEERELANHGTSTGFRVHRIVANRWSLVREDGRWSIASRTVLPMDGSGPALEMARQAATYYAGR
ncbi:MULTISPECIES: nuclear transport factor 2 family protein [Streptomyces violaceusniger group]|nr:MULTISPECIES: nuclear transport factor 2 family protein [Streptomyces violaceusniger group]